MLSSLRRNFLFDSVERISRLNAITDLSDELVRTMGEFGFTSLGINGLPPATGGADPIILTEIAPTGFRDLYIHERLYLSDHICANARTAREPFSYSDAVFDRSNTREHQMFLQALQTFEMGQGLIVPIGNTTVIPACMWLAGPRPDLDQQTVVATQLLALFASSKAHAIAGEVSRRSDNLTPREREVLAWSAQGKSAWEIGEILFISKRTVDEHAQTAMRKLGAVNRTQAVAIALMRGIFDA
jgi:LuxR family quorum sensing-dependent transcriptional regulator